jgi:alpha-glucosidase
MGSFVRDFNLPWRIGGCLAAVAGVLLSAPQASPAFAQPGESADRMFVTQEDDRTFRIDRAESVAALVTFLSPTTLRVRILPPEPATSSLPEYVTTKSDSSYPPVDVRLDAQPDKVTFSTSAAILNLSLDDQVVSLELRSRDKVLIDNWEIDDGERVARIELQNAERIYGFGDKRAALDQRGRKIAIVNRDAFASESNQSYKSVPFYMSSAGYGLFFHNYRPSNFDVGASVKNRLQLKATGGEMDFYVFVGSMKEVLSQYTELTGRPAMLPLWAFGYHQGKATYRGREGLEVAQQMRQRKLPFDVIYYDAFDPEATSRAFIDALWERYRGRLTVGFGMPMFGVWHGNDDSALLNDLAARGFLMVDRNNRPAIGRDANVEEVEDKSSVAYLDYFSTRAVDHVFAVKWTNAIKNGAALGMVDFGELDHVRNADQKFWPSINMSVAETRNLFGLVYPLAVVNGMLDRVGGRSTGMVRPGFAGSQRLGWTTTGDSVPTYANFRAHTRAVLNLTLSGFSNVGQDIGGWDGKSPDTLYARWFAAATFYPFMWSHGKDDHEPYSHGDAVESAARSFLNLRYHLVPYLYSLHEAAHRTGIPILRPFLLQEPQDPTGVRIDDQFFVGDNILVAPVFNDEGDRKLYLPEGRWYDFFGELQPVQGGGKIEREAVPLDRLPVYVRAGSVIPLGPAMQYTGQKPVDPLSVHVYGFAPVDLAGARRISAFSLYEDDGLSIAYRGGEFQRTDLRFSQNEEMVRFDVSPESGDGDFQSVARRGYRLNFHGIEGAVSQVRLDGRAIPEANADSGAGERAAWSRNEWSGDVSVFVPPSAPRAFTVEFATERRGDPAPKRSVQSR